MTRLDLLVGLSATALLAPLAVAAATVYIPEGSANSVLAVEAETGAVLARIGGLEAIHGLAGAPGGKYLVAGSYTEIARDDAAAAAKPEGVSADEHAAHHAKPARTALPDDMGLSLVTVLDAATGEVVRRIEVPGAVHHTAVSPDDRWAIATHPAGDGISVIDLETLEYRGFVATGPLPNYAEFAPAGGKVYVTNTGNGTLSEVDVAQGYVTRNMRAGETPEHLVLTARGLAAFVADADAGKVHRIDLAIGAVTDTYEIGGEIHGLGLSEREGLLFVAAKSTDQLVAIDLATGKQRSESLAPAPYHLTTIPGTGHLFVSSREAPKVWIVDQATMKPTGEIAIKGEGHQMVALP